MAEIQPIGDAPPPPVEALRGGPISQQDNTPAAAGTPTQAAPNVTSGEVSGAAGVNMELATTISKAIALGLVQAPTSAAGWAQLVDKFDNTGGQNEVKVAEMSQPSQPSQTPTPAAASATPQPAQPTTTASAAPFSGGGSESQWAATVLTRAGVPVTQNNVNNMMRWMTAEEPTSDWSHADNPLNINAGGTGFDTFGSLDQSATSTANVLKQPNMAHIWSALASNADPNSFSAAVVGSPWAASHYGGDPNHIAQIQVPAGTAQVAPQPTQAPQATPTEFQGSSNVVKLAQGQLGVPYRWGGESPGKAFDCSGLVQYVYGRAGDNLPRTAQEQYNSTPHVQSGANLQPGDLLFFGSGPGGVEHVGIYIGNGQMIDAPHTGADVRVDQVFGPNGQALWGNYVGATRPADPTGQTTAAPNTPVAQAVQKSQDTFGSILSDVMAQMTRFSPNHPQLKQEMV